jgi:hypothetical protein
MTYFWLKDGQSPWVLSRALDSLQTLLGCISRVQQCLSPRRNWDSPSPESECVPSPEPKRVGTLACEWGGGGFPIPTRRQTLLYSRYVCASSLWMCVPPSPLNSVMSKIMTNLCPWNSENPCKWHPPPPPSPPPLACVREWGSPSPDDWRESLVLCLFCESYNPLFGQTYICKYHCDDCLCYIDVDEKIRQNCTPWKW